MSRLDSSSRDSFEEFVAARRQALLRTAYLLTGDHGHAEDLVQTAMVKAWPRWSRIADRPEPYVRTVLAREVTNRWRSRRWREVSTGTLPDTAAETRDPTDREVLRRALLELSPRQRAVVVLRYFDDLTEQQTAEVLGIGLGTVKSHGRDALARLRVLVPEAAPEAVDTVAP
ncbi:SigE family RNA polymerase sigma factor [Nocardioides ginkgobilobae]